MDDILKTLRISSAGMKVQGERLRVISENIANADSLATDQNSRPYRRKTITFRNEFDRAIGLDTVRVDKVRPDLTDFQKRYMPGHPAADGEGYVLYPNVNPLIELMDMREAQRSFEANLTALQQARGMLQRTLDLLR